jgi:DNA repair protein RadC
VIDRIKAMGVKSAAVVDLIAIGFSRSEADAFLAEGMARSLLTKFGSVRAFGEAAPADLAHATGVEGFELLRTQALMEIGRRVGMAGKGPVKSIDAPEDVAEVLYEMLQRLRGEKREHFFAVLLDSQGAVMRVAEIHIGTLTMSIVGAREVFREAIRDGACSVIVGHNHPSGDPTPSPEDIEVTRRLVELGEMLDIRVEDHVILGEQDFTSLKRQRLM